MNKFLPYIVAGVLLVGGGIAYFALRGSDTPQTSKPQNSVSLSFDSPLCDQIPSSVAEEALGKKVVKTETVSNSTTNACQYFTDDTHFVTLRLNRLNYASQKEGQQALGRTITTNDQIKMQHFVAVQENGLINDIILKIEDGVILAVDRSSGSAASEDNIIAFATKVAVYIQAGGTKEDKPAMVVPEPSEEDVLRNFFQLIEEKKASEAVLAMSLRNTSDDSTKQAWGVQFNRINSVKVVSVEPSMQDNWTESSHSYKVVLDLTMDPTSADAPIPYYGYENGKNTRFIMIVKEDRLWKIDGIATGP